ncbi:hypothetical protein pb186bvf_021214 [Paramecium bursaria]
MLFLIQSIDKLQQNNVIEQQLCHVQINEKVQYFFKIWQNYSMHFDFFKLLRIFLQEFYFIQIIERAFSLTFKFNARQDDQVQKKQDYYSGPFKKIIYFEGQEITRSQYLDLISNQQVLRVERCAQSLTGAFPSGLISAFTMLVGIAVRHEYALIYTDDFVISMEIEKVNHENVVIAIRIFQVNNQNKLSVKKIICENRWYTITLEEAIPGDSTLYLIQMDHFINLLITIWRFYGNGQYDITQKNCKSFARSILQFSCKQLDKIKIFEAILGVFNDFGFSIRLKIMCYLKSYGQEIQKFHQMINIIRKDNQLTQ